jgi:hypothetical protein
MPTSSPTPLANAGTAASLTTTDGVQLDPTVVKLMKGIKTVESNGNYTAKGKSGEFGAYQFMPDTYAAEAPKYGVDPSDYSPAAQNKVAYFQLKSFKDQGYTPEQAAAAWNGGPGVVENDKWKTNVGVNSKGVAFDTPGYVQKVINAAKGEQLPTSEPQQAPEAPSIGGFAGNVVKSGANFAGNIGNALLHPIDTIENIGGAAVGGLQELGGQQNDNTAKFDNLVDFFKNRYGSVSQLEHTLYTDPVGVAADLSTVLSGGAALAGKVGTLGGVADASRASSLAAETGLRTMAQDASVGNTLTRTGKALGTASDLTNPLTPVMAGGARVLGSDTAKTVGETLASKVTGMEPSTIQQVLKTPEAFTPDAIANATRKSLADEIKTTIDDRRASLSDTGKEYSPIRDASTPIGVSKNFLDQQFQDIAGVSAQDGKIITSASAKVRDARDVRALQNLYDTYKPVFSRGALTTNEYLNFRTDLAKLAKFERDFGKSNDLESIAAQIRGKFNDRYRGDIPGLSALDEKYSHEINTLNDLEAGFFKKNGDPVANFTNKIARSIGAGKDDQLAQLERINPGITQRLKVQNAIEDIQRASGNKVGTYTKSTLEAGGVVLGAMTGNVHILAGALATAIFASPEIAVPLLKVFGFKHEIVSNVLAKLARMVTAPTELNRATQDSSGQPQPEKTDTTQETVTSPEPTPVQ